LTARRQGCGKIDTLAAIPLVPPQLTLRPHRDSEIEIVALRGLALSRKF
jgi:hypothetical protein